MHAHRLAQDHKQMHVMLFAEENEPFMYMFLQQHMNVHKFAQLHNHRLQNITITYTLSTTA